MKKIISCIILLLISSSLLLAQKSEREVNAIPLGENEIDLDGKLSEDIWAKAQPMKDYLQKSPNFNAQPLEKTEVYFIYDEKHLYIGARMQKNAIDSIQSFIARRDKMGNSERVIISLDTYNNQTTAYSFAITATGVRSDYYHSEDKEHSRDYDWNPVWSGKSFIDI
jgi:hypothetical protein